MRKWLYAAVKSCPRQAELFNDRIYSAASVEGPEGAGDVPNGDFIVIRLSPNQSGLGRVKQQTAQVWLHTFKTSMLPMDELAEELEDWLPSQAPASFAGDWVMDCEWQGTSGDGFDDHFNTNTRYVTVLVTHRPG